MKRRLSILNEYKTPDEWKQRAKKIAEGKGIYAKVKTNSRLKIAIAAAVALLIGIEGYFLFKNSNSELKKSLDPSPAETVEDEGTKLFKIKQRIKNYYPDAEDSYIEELAADYNEKGAYVLITADSGRALTCSHEISDSGVMEYMALNPNDGFVCDGYITGETKLTALIRLTLDDSYNTETGNDPITDTFTPKVSFYDRINQSSIEPKSVDMKVTKVLNSYYAVIEADIGDKLPETGFNNVETDIHLYNTYWQTDRKTGNVLDESKMYNPYHTDIKILKNSFDLYISSKDDRFDKLYEYCDKTDGAFYDEDDIGSVFPYYDMSSTVKLGKKNSITENVNDRIEPSETMSYFATNDSYAKNIKFESGGIITDGVNAKILLHARAPGMLSNDEYFKSFDGDSEYKLYLMPDGKELECEVTEAVCSDENKNERYYMVSVSPKLLLDGQKIELHILSTDERYNDESLHYIFTYNIPDRTERRNTGVIESYDKHSLSDESFSGSIFGILVTGADAFISGQIENADAGDEIAYARVIGSEAAAEYIALHNNGDIEGSDEWQPFFKYGDAVSGSTPGTIINIKTADGESAGYYFNYGEIAQSAGDFEFAADLNASQINLLQQGRTFKR